MAGGLPWFGFTRNETVSPDSRPGGNAKSTRVRGGFDPRRPAHARHPALLRITRRSAASAERALAARHQRAYTEVFGERERLALKRFGLLRCPGATRGADVTEIVKGPRLVS